MKTVIIACKTLENELNVVMESIDCHFDIIWFPSGLHNTPNKLTTTLQELIDSSTNYDTALFAMGFCGNCVAGLNSRHLRLIIPRVDDCISLILGSRKNRANLPEGHRTYFLTEGWIKGERNLWVEYQYTLNRYGDIQGKEIFEMMLANYKYLALVDTKCFDFPSTEQEVKHMADIMALQYKKIEGTTSYLEDLLQSPWDKEKFLEIPPHTVIKAQLLQQLY